MYLEYQLTEQEYKDFSYYTGWSSPEKEEYRVRYYALYVIAYLIFLAIIFTVAGKTLRTSIIETILIVLAVAILFLFFMIFSIKSRFVKFVEKQIQDSGRERILPLLKLVIDESGIKGSTYNTESNLKWAAIFKKAEVNNCYYLYLDSISAIVIPKRALTSDNEKEEFKKILLAYFPLKAELDHLNK